MATETKVSYAHHTASPWIGCTKVSPGCQNCYAEAMVDVRKIFGKGEPKNWGPKAARRPPKNIDAYWRKVRGWNNKAAKAGVKERVLVSMCDVFDDHSSIQPEWRITFWTVVRETPHLIWIILTKRPDNCAIFLPPDWGEGYPNVWLGVSVENQEQADRRIPILLKTKAAKHIISAEPLLGPLNLEKHLLSCRDCGNQGSTGMGLNRPGSGHDLCRACIKGEEGTAGIEDLIIVGGESGRGARHTDIRWIEPIVAQCKAASVPVYVKQLGKNYFRSDIISDVPAVFRYTTKHPKGADMAEWPENLRVQELPE